MISNTAVFLIVVPVVLVIFTLMDPFGRHTAASVKEPEKLPVLPVQQPLPSPVLLPLPPGDPRVAQFTKQSHGDPVQVEPVASRDQAQSAAVHAVDAFFEEIEEEAPLVEPPENWEQMAQYQGRAPTFDYSESDRYKIAVPTDDEEDLLSEEQFDVERGVFHAATYKHDLEFS